MRSLGLQLVTFISIMSLLPLRIMAVDSTTHDLIKQADYLQRRHEILSQNIANVSTPKYIAQDLEKPEFLVRNQRKVKVPKVRMMVTNNHHLRGNKNKTDQYSIVLDKTSPMKPNKNNVDLTKQVTNITQNSDETTAALKHYRTAMDLINTAAGSGGQ